MGNTSATGGYLTPLGPPPKADQALQLAFVRMIVGISGLPPKMVRPRWQPVAPQQPEPEVDWAAIEVQSERPDGYGYLRPNADGTKHTLNVHWALDVLCSFYGPNAAGYARRLSDGLLIAQNRDAILKDGIKYVGGGATSFSTGELVNTRWIRRVDLPLEFRRSIISEFDILSLRSLQGQLNSEALTQHFEEGLP